MSIEVNGVTLPDIPSEVLEQYPYAVIYKETRPAGTIYYALCVSKTAMLYMSKEVSGDTSGAEAVIYNTYAYRAFYDSDTSEWGDLAVFNNGYVDYEGQMGVAVGTFQNYVYEWVYTNHDIYEATAINTSTGEITLGEVWMSSSLSDPNYFAPKSWFDAIARQVMRLTGTSDKLNTDKMLELAKGVEVGGGGGLTFETSASGTTS